MQDRPIRPAQGYRNEDDEDSYQGNKKQIVEEDKEDDDEQDLSYDFHENEGVVAGEEGALEKQVANYMDRGEYQEAYHDLKRLEILDQSKPETYLKMAQCQTELKLFIQAIKSLQLAVDLEPKHASSNSSKRHYKENKIILQNSNDI